MYAVQRFYLKPSEVQKEQISAKMHCIPFVMPKKKKKLLKTASLVAIFINLNL